MKTFGLLVPAGKGSIFEKNVRSLLADQDGLASIVLPMLEAWRGIRIRAAELGRQLVRDARQIRLAASLCPFPALVRSPQPPSPLPLRGRTTSRNPDPLEPGLA